MSSNSPEPIDVRLREYAARWRAAEPSPPSVDLTRLAARPTRWIAPVLAAVVTGLVLFIGLVVLRPGLIRDEPVRPASPTASATATAGTVAWLALEPGFASVPTITIPPSPDPSVAANLPSCRADQLSAERSADAATGTRLLFVTFSTSGSGCALNGRPQVTAHGTADIPVEPGGWGDDYGYPVRVAGTDLAVLTLSWESNWCGAPVTNDRIDLVLPDGGGTVEIAGFGESACRYPEGPARVPILVGSFQPQDYTPGRVATAFVDVHAGIQMPQDASVGSTLRFAVTLTALGRDVVLSPCPDYAIDVSREPDDTDTVSYQLNCSSVPYRDPAGRPYLPANTPVRFAMELVIPDLPGTHKLTWRLEVPDPVMAGGSLVIH
jgi:hypothetical protein